MGLFDRSKKKDEIVEETETRLVSENTESTEDSEIIVEENETMSETKKKYMYLALDENGIVVLDDNMKPVVSNTTEENAPIVWPDGANMYAKRIVCDMALRVEVSAIPPKVRDQKGKKDAKRQSREDAKEKLFELAAEKIAEAKKIRSRSAVETKATAVTVDSRHDRVSQDNSKANAEQTKGSNGKFDMSQAKVNDCAQKTETPSDKPKADDNGDAKKIVSAIDKVSEQINQDITNAVDDILGTIAENDKDLSSDIKGTVQEQGRNIDARTKIYIEEAIDILGQKTQKSSEDVSRKVNDAGRSISESQDKIISKVNAVGKRMGDLVESVEGIEGNLTRLEQLDEIVNLLRDKGLNISMEIPPVNAEEEDIINLVRYSQKITEQLGYAARDLIRKREAFKNQAENNENEQKVMAQRIEVARQEGMAEGKLQAVKQLLSKYEDIDAIKDSTENYIHVIWIMLTELGVVIDGDGFYEKGKEIDLTDGDIEKMMATYSKFDGAGKYRVVRTGLSLHGEIIYVAQFSKVTEEDKPDGDSSSQKDEKQSDSESEEAKADVNQEEREESKTAEQETSKESVDENAIPLS